MNKTPLKTRLAVAEGLVRDNVSPRTMAPDDLRRFLQWVAELALNSVDKENEGKILAYLGDLAYCLAAQRMKAVA